MKLFCILVFLTILSSPVFSQTEVMLSKDGKALFPVVISEKSSEKTKKNAEQLCFYLNKITGANFNLITGDGTNGIAVGVFTDFPSLSYSNLFDVNDPFRRDEYVIKSHKNGIHIIGVTELATQDAIWDFLYQLGYRQFFPGPHWEIIPEIKNLTVKLDVYGKPSFYGRYIGKDHGFWQYNKQTWDDWMNKNRMQSNFFVPSGHSYEGILAANKDIFQQHPEYLGLVNEERKSSKFCISNPELQKIVVDYAIKYFEKNPDAYGLSMEPSDGGNWCECENCKKIGSISDRAVMLANIVAKAIKEKFGNKFVGMLAYNYHAPYPSIKVEPNVIVNITTHQRKGGYTLDELIEGWREKGAIVGVSDAFATSLWDYSLPGRPRVSDITYLTENLPSFYQKGVRLISGWTEDAWGPIGLGNYLLSRLLWDINETKKVDKLFSDFLEKSFGSAKQPMEKFYRLIYRIDTKEKEPLLSQDLIGRMYRLLDEALKKTQDPAVRARIYDLIMYTGYAENYLKFVQADKDKQQACFEQLMKYIYRMRYTQMIDTVSIYITLQDMAKYITENVVVPDEAKWNVPEGKNPWKIKEPFTEEEIKEILKTGIDSNPVFPFEQVTFSKNLIPVKDIKNIVVKDKEIKGDEGVQMGGTQQKIYTWIENAPMKIKLKVTGGLIAHYRDYGNVYIQLFSAKFPDKPVAEDKSVPPDGMPHEIVMETSYNGLHWFKISSGGDRTKVEIIEPDIAWTFESGIKERTYRPGTMWSLYFYVPKGTKTIAGYSFSGTGKILDCYGKEVFSFKELPPYSYFTVDVGEGKDGKLWMFSNCNGQKLLLNVPPYMAPDAKKLLLPEEIVKKDFK